MPITDLFLVKEAHYDCLSEDRLSSQEAEEIEEDDDSTRNAQHPQK